MPKRKSNNLKKPEPFIFNMMSVHVGHEKSLLEKKIKLDAESLYFKIMGDYDILAFSRLNTIHDANTVDPEQHVLGSTIFPGFYWSGNKINLWNKISSSASPCLVFLKVNDIVSESLGVLGLNQVITFFEKNIKKFNVYPLSGFGYYEIILWYPTDTLQSIFEVLRALRSLKVKDVIAEAKPQYANYGIFSDTSTLPLISYKNVILQQNWSMLKGKINPIMTAKCSPIYEVQVAESVGEKAHDLLGEDDIIFNWTDSIAVDEFIPKLLDFRMKWQDKQALVCTKTNLLSLEPVSPEAGEVIHQETLPPNYLAEELRSLLELDRVNRYLINEIRSIVSLLNSYIAYQASSSTYIDVYQSIDYLNNLLIQYRQALDSGDVSDKIQKEAKLLEMIESMRTALSQRFPGIEIASSAYGTPPLATYSVSRVLIAASAIIESIYSVLTKITPPDKLSMNSGIDATEHERLINKFNKQWKGFTYFDLTEGYRLYRCEIISMPLLDLYYPLNWSTLSHEVSHSWFIRTSFLQVEASFLQRLRGKIESRAKEDQLSTTMFGDKLEDTVWEFFAHWFDYRHFYSGDLNFYLWNIWRTWLLVPSVIDHIPDYWCRAVFIQMCDSWSEIYQKLKKMERLYRGKYHDYRKNVRNLIENQIDNMESLVNEFFPDEYPKIKVQDKLLKKYMIDILYSLYHLAPLFESNYVNNELQQIFIKKYTGINEQVKSILNGKVIIDSIENPFILIREILRHFYAKADRQVNLETESVIALIYSLWDCGIKCSRRYNDAK